MINKEIKKIISEVVKDLYKDIEISDFVVEYSHNKKYGDYASNVAMVLAGKMNKNSMKIAWEIQDKIDLKKYKDIFQKINIANPGFINFEISEKYLIENLKNVLKKKCKFGSSSFGNGKTVLIDYSAPNIAKPMHVGHLRSAIVGQSLYNIYKFLGYKVIGDNHIGDWGSQFGKLIYGYKHWGDKKKISKNPIAEMTKLYVRFHKEAEKKLELDEFARKETKRLQEGNSENLKIWKYLVKESIKDYNKIYKILNIKFDYILPESFYNDMLLDIVNKAINQKVATKSEGAIVINLDKYNLSAFLIKKTDGAYLYSTTDIATAKYREKKFKVDKILYVVANEQALHFQKLFSALELLGICRNVDLEHIKFGMVLGENGKKFSTRKGEIIKLVDLIHKSIKLAQKVVEEKNPKLSKNEKKKIAKKVGIGAIKYNDLSQNRLTDIIFDWDKILSFDGNNAPYLLYTYARINSLIEKFNKIHKLNRINILDKSDFSLLKKDIEKNIMMQLLRFPNVIENSAKENSPHLIALYIYELSSAYNSFYNSIPILKSEKKIAKARLNLSRAVAIIIKNGLNLLGIDVLERM